MRSSTGYIFLALLETKQVKAKATLCTIRENYNHILNGIVVGDLLRRFLAR